MPYGVRVRLPPCVPYQEIDHKYNRMFFLINKPSGITSYSFAEKFAKRYGFSKFGHTGTLDALATGALLVAVGPDTKLISYITDKTKCYEAVAILGYSSDTLDMTGNITTYSCNAQLTVEELKHAMERVFVRTRQMPPEYSAKKINSVRASDIARRGGAPTLTLVDVTIY